MADHSSLNEDQSWASAITQWLPERCSNFTADVEDDAGRCRGLFGRLAGLYYDRQQLLQHQQQHAAGRGWDDEEAAARRRVVFYTSSGGEVEVSVPRSQTPPDGAPA
eukprot:TRINITY_DN65917_c0_g1_i1.p2 TRINITY_DN65917_c0_g1~~TRINITY_DN65917_c0_g1_i1.p2  ORF type:complete len:107 (+),score=18.29 TRINITY_DN65917_c0_g1_i1:74-394(+)